MSFRATKSRLQEPAFCCPEGLERVYDLLAGPLRPKTASAALKMLAIPRGIPALFALQPQLFEHNGPRAEIINTL